MQAVRGDSQGLIGRVETAESPNIVELPLRTLVRDDLAMLVFEVDDFATDESVLDFRYGFVSRFSKPRSPCAYPPIRRFHAAPATLRTMPDPTPNPDAIGIGVQ